MTKRRAIALIGALAATWIGCSSDHGDGGSSRGSAARAGAAGETSTAGLGGATAGMAAGAGTNGAAGSGAGGVAAGGMAGAAANAGASSLSAGRSGSAGSGAVPAGWTCDGAAYGDGQCHCGCGAPDEDCKGSALDDCAICSAVGSCSTTPCPGRIDPSDVTKCPLANAPPLWTCKPELYGDGTCHCGCGVVDSDCADANATSCEVCDGSSCSPFACAVVADDNAHCPEPPTLWTCSARLYNDGQRCDCGCGAFDPDCSSVEAAACDKCDAPGSCSAQPCPGLVNADQNSLCDHPDAPAGWTCPPTAYADGLECDCGCGVPDLDCRDAAATSCVRCLVCGGHGSCEVSVDVDDTTQCAPPPDGWLCSADSWRDGICDCGCGIPDKQCQDIELFYVCANYPVEGCTAGNRSHLDPNHNAVCLVNVPSDWTCDRSYYDDGFCDCGCGVVDMDCPANDRADCEQCDGMGSCSRSACPGTISETDTAHCTAP